jgi:flagellar biosynthesis/type III secretory pathway protein FliH
MKINDLRTLIREEIQNELAEAKKKKKKEAKEKIMEIIIEAELTEEEVEEGFKTKYEEGSVEGDENVKKDAEAKIEAFIAAKPVAAAYKDMLLKQIPAIVTKAAGFKKPVVVKVEIINKKPTLTVVGAAAVSGIGKFFGGGAGAKGSAGAMGI